ncbi:MAG: hypothetical protein JO250_04210 [Armatimonadetes bacterium]|nr:hypothetical protein [Armatimonadota bacterium]
MSRLIRAVVALIFLAALPAHAEKNLRRPPGTTRYAPMVARLKALLAYDQNAGAHRMELSSIGQSVKGRDIWMVTLHEAAPAEAATPARPSPLPSPQAGEGPVTQDSAAGQEAQPDDTGPSLGPTGEGWPKAGVGASPKKLFYLCRQHGHEPASTEGALAFIEKLVKAQPGSPLARDLQRVTVYIVPMANPDGAEAFLRHNAHDVDLNRDWLRQTQPETRAWLLAIKRIHPDLMTDQHELYPNDRRWDFTETAGAASGADPGLVTMCVSTQSVVQGAMQAEGFPTACHLINDHHPARLAHRYGCVVAGIPTILFETNRLTWLHRSVAARAAAHAQFMADVLRDLAGERDQLEAEARDWQIAHARNTLLASRKKGYQRVPPAPNSGEEDRPPTPNSGGVGEETGAAEKTGE